MKHLSIKFISTYIDIDSISFMTYHKSNLYPAWQDSSYLLWLQSLQFSSSDLCCFIPNTFQVRLWKMLSMQISYHPPLAPHLHRETTDRTYNTSELTTRMALPVVRVKLVSMHRPFSNCAGSLATSNHLPMNYKGKTTQALKYLSCHQWRIWINLHTSVVWIKYAARAPPNLFLTNRKVNIKI